MNRAIRISAGVLGAGILTLLGVIAYVEIGRALGQQWSSFDGPEPVWPAVVGFSAMYLIPISAVVLIVLVAVAAVRGSRLGRPLRSKE